MRGAEQFSPRTRLFTGCPAEYRATWCVRAAGAPVVGRAPARTAARSVVVPPGLPGHVVPEESWFRLETRR
jgi:L-lactate dehydrogenase complex protein LldG